MANKAKTEDFYRKYIADNSELYVSISNRNMSNLDNFENLNGEELKKLYLKVQASIRRHNNKANQSSETVNVDMNAFGKIKEMIKKSKSTEEVIEYQSQLEDLVAVCVDQLEKIMQKDIEAKEDLAKELIEQLNRLGKKYKLVEED